MSLREGGKSESLHVPGRRVRIARAVFIGTTLLMIAAICMAVARL